MPLCSGGTGKTEDQCFVSSRRCARYTYGYPTLAEPTVGPKVKRRKGSLPLAAPSFRLVIVTGARCGRAPWVEGSLSPSLSSQRSVRPTWDVYSTHCTPLALAPPATKLREHRGEGTLPLGMLGPPRLSTRGRRRNNAARGNNKGRKRETRWNCRVSFTTLARLGWHVQCGTDFAMLSVQRNRRFFLFTVLLSFGDRKSVV